MRWHFYLGAPPFKRGIPRFDLGAHPSQVSVAQSVIASMHFC